ncbi:MAG: hypothetical protein AAF799_38235 [Myxococcota bacterium]
MADVELGSRSDLEALQRSSRGKVITLLLLLGLALGAAGWFFFLRKQGTGNPESATKVLYVGTNKNLGLALRDVGFELELSTFEAWQLKARDEVPDLETDGIESIMALADRFGYGYVIFEKPQGVDFSPLDIEEVQPMPDHVRFAVLSVGDFAFPHVMTVNPEGKGVLEGSLAVVLQALFAQPKLAEALPDAEGASIAAIQLRDGLRDALDHLAKVPQAEALADKVLMGVRRELGDKERGEPKPTTVGAPLEQGVAFPLANGAVLSIGRQHHVRTRDALRAWIDEDEQDRMWVGKPGAEAAEREACKALFGGELPLSDAPKYYFGDDGASLIVKTYARGLEVFTLDTAAQGSCPWKAQGALKSVAPGLGRPEPAGHGQVALVGMASGQAVVSVVTPGQDNELMLGMLDGIELERVAWASDRYLVALGRGYEGARVFLFDTQTPLKVLALPSTVFENASKLNDLAVGRRGDSPVIVVTTGSRPSKAYRLELPASLPELFASPPVAEASAEVEEEPVDPTLLAPAYEPPPPPSREERGLPAVIDLDSNEIQATALTHEGRVSSLHVSNDGKWLAAVANGGMYDSNEPGDSEVIVVPTDGGSVQVLTRNPHPDDSPRLTPDGSHVVFRTTVEVPKTDNAIGVARVVTLAH